MPRDQRDYITVVAAMPEHWKIEGLSDAAFRLLIESWCWCKRQHTDGFIPEAAWTRRRTAKIRGELLAAGLVEEAPNGVVMHDYPEHQWTEAQAAERSALRAAAGAAGGRAKAANRAASAKQASSNGSSKPVASAKQTASKRVAEENRREENTPPGGADNAAASSKSLASATPNAQALVAEWIDLLGPARKPPERVVGRVAKEVGAMLREGIPYEDVRMGLGYWQQRGLDPSVLSSVVHEYRTASTRVPRPSQQPGGIDWDEARRIATELDERTRA